jgi:predicted acyl esterase
MAVQVDQKITIDFDAPAKMRDGTTPRANIYRPAGEGQWPVLLNRLPYGKDFPKRNLVRGSRSGGTSRLCCHCTGYPNTGHEFGASSEQAVAHQTILHDREHPSYVLLPVVPQD